MAKTLTVYLAADLKKFSGGMRDAERQIGGFSLSLKDMLGPALIAAGTAAAAFAVKLGVDGVQAAIEDEKAVAALATTLGNLNMAHSTDEIEAYIYELERAYGVADTELRPAYDRLIRSTKDVEEANMALKTAMDISASTGKSLQTVTDALGRAYDGNTAGLGRLGLGIDKAALSAMSMDEVMAALSTTFAGQADASARTFEGQLQRLQTAADNVKEAFGAGFLNALGDTDAKTQDLVDSMERLEPLMQDIGAEAGEIALGFGDLAIQLSEIQPSAGSAAGAIADVGNAWTSTFGFGAFLDTPENLSKIISGMRILTDENYRMQKILEYLGPDINEHRARLELYEAAALRAAEAQIALNSAQAKNDDVRTRAQVTRENAERNRQRRLLNDIREENEERERQNDLLDTNTRRITTNRNETEKLTKAQKELVETYELQGIAFQTTKTELMEQIKVVEDATAAVENYAGTIQSQLLGGLDLMGAYEAAKAGGGDLSLGLAEGFQRQIDQIEWAGNVLAALKAANVEQSLIEYLAAQGPEAGGALGQALLDDRGLLGTINEQWSGIQDRTRELALELVPEFLTSGRESATKYLQALGEKFGEDQRSFKKLGNLLGRQVGQEFKARTLKEIADAVKQVESLATAARAEAVARAERQQARITEQAVAEAINNLIRNSDQRAGRNVQPVLQ